MEIYFGCLATQKAKNSFLVSDRRFLLAIGQFAGTPRYKGSGKRANGNNESTSLLYEDSKSDKERQNTDCRLVENQ